VKQGDTNEESNSGLSQYNGDMKITRYGGGSLVVNLRIRRFGVRVPASAPFLFVGVSFLRIAFVAQWIEHLTSDQTVGSSSLSGRT